jgi:hypothetical protein
LCALPIGKVAGTFAATVPKPGPSRRLAKIEASAIHSVLGFVEQLVLKHFS